MTVDAKALEAAARRLLDRYEALDRANGQTAHYALVVHAAGDWQALADVLTAPRPCPICKGKGRLASLAESGWRK